MAHRGGDHAAEHPPEFELQFVEADDEGWFWEPAQATAALSLVEKAAAKNDTIVLLFVHGWHHSATCCDGNVEGFKEVLRRLRTELDKPMYAEARKRVHAKTGVPDAFRVIGIYIGWRGRSLPKVLDYTTFWGRKAAAQRVGQADFQEFMIRLQRIYDNQFHPKQDGKERTAPTFLGLVSIGHSFGGQVMLSATSWFFENELQGVNPVASFLRDDTVSGPHTSLSEPLRGFGDLVILVNPAVEAAAYQRVHALAKGLDYSDKQTPLLLTISADNDGPRHALFEFGRTAGEVFTGAPYKEDARERQMKRQALGVYGQDGAQITHRLAPVDESLRLTVTELTREHESFCSTERHCSFDWYQWNGRRPGTPDTLDTTDASDAQAKRIARFDFAQQVTFADVTLKPTAGAMKYQAMIVATAHEGVIDGHNGMFSEPLMDFLLRYIGFTEAKRYLIAAERNFGMTVKRD